MDPSFFFIILLAHSVCLPSFSVAGFCATYKTRNITQFCDSQTFDGSDLYLDTYKASTRRTYCYCYFQSNTDTTITLSTKDYPLHTTTSCKTTSRIEYKIYRFRRTSGIICGYAAKQIDIQRGQFLHVTFYNELANLENYCLSVKTATAAHTLHAVCFSDKSTAADTSTNPATTSKQLTTKQRQEEASVTTKNQGKNTTTTADSTTTVTTTDVTSPGDTTTSVTTTDVTSPGDTTTNGASKGYTTTDATSPGDTTTNGASKGYTTRGSTYTVGIPSGTLTGHTTSSASPGGTSRIGTTTGDATTIGTTTSVNVLQGTSFKYRLPLTILIPLICVGLLFFIVVITVVAVCIRRRNKNKGNLKDENVKRDSDNGDDMVYNELYHTFGSNGGHVLGDACAGAAVPVHAIELNTGGLGEYAEVSIQHTDTDNMKKIDENNCDGDQNKDCGPVYAMPDKTKKQDSEQGPIYAMPNKEKQNEKEEDGATPIYAVPDKKKDK